jgi:DNA-directed RNA polymerase specialized sigma24 family protein
MTATSLEPELSFTWDELMLRRDLLELQLPRWHKILVNRARRLVRAFFLRSEPEELVQTVYLKFFKSPTPWANNEPITANRVCARLLCILRNTCIDEIRKGRNKLLADIPEGVLATIPTTTDSSGTEVERHLMFEELMQRLDSAIDTHVSESMSHSQRTQLKRFLRAAVEIDGRSMVDKQLAEVLGVRPSDIVNLRKRLVRMRRIDQLRTGKRTKAGLRTDLLATGDSTEPHRRGGGSPANAFHSSSIRRDARITRDAEWDKNNGPPTIQ